MIHKRVAIYARISSATQDYERQIAELTKFASDRKYEIIGIFKEIKQGKARLKEREKVLELAKKKEIDAILVSELFRWGRSSTDLILTLEQLYNWKVGLICYNGYEFDFNSSQGKLFAGLLAILAEFERDLISERVKSGLALAKSKGKKLGRPQGTCSKQKKLKTKILSLRSEGKSYREIAKYLNCSVNTVKSVINPTL